MIPKQLRCPVLTLMMATAHCGGEDPEAEGELGTVVMELDSQAEACTYDNPFDAHAFPVMHREVDEVMLSLRRGNPLSYKRTVFTRADLDALCDPANTNFIDRSLRVGVGPWEYQVFAYGPDDTITNDLAAPGATGQVFVEHVFPTIIHAVIKAASGDVYAILEVDGESYDDAYGTP